jgi:GDP-fucose transporter C1
MVVSLALVFANKIMMKNLEFPYPLFLSWAQWVVAEICILIGGFLSPRYPQYFSLFAPLEWDWAIAWKVTPLTVVYIVMITLNNVCLRYVEVTFYQVARSLTLPWTITMTLVLFPEQGIDVKTIFSCLVVFSGFVIGSLGEVNFSWAGLIAGVISSGAVAYYGIAIKKALPHVGGSQWRLLIYNTTISIFMSLPIMYFFDELPGVNNIVISNQIWNAIWISGVLGFLINIAIFMQVKYTTPLTNAISGTAKACIQTLLGWLFFRNEVSFMNFMGIVAVIGGSGWYSQIRYEIMKVKEALDEKQKAQDVERGAGGKS